MADAPIPMQAGAGAMARAKDLIRNKFRAKDELKQQLTQPKPAADPIKDIINRDTETRDPIKDIIYQNAKEPVMPGTKPNDWLGPYMKTKKVPKPMDTTIVEMIGATSPHKRYLTPAKRRRNFIVPRSRPLGGAKLAGRNVSEEEQIDEMPVRLINKALAAYKYKKEKGSRGPHDKWKHENGTTVAVPRHREIADGTARAIFKQAGISEAAQIKKNVIRNLRKKLKAEEAIEQGGRTDTGSTGDNIRLNPTQTDRVNTKPIKNVDQGQTR